MELILDANILVAGFLRSATTRELLLDDRLSLWTPEHSLTETERVLTAGRFRKRLGGLATPEIRFLLNQLTTHVRIAPAATYHGRLPEAQRLAPHVEDAPYLALALHLRLPVWSNDADLKTCQQVVEVYTTEEVLKQLTS